MKKVLLAFLISGLITACNNEKKNDDKTGGDKTETKTMKDDIAYPYKAEYADFKMGDPNHTKLVLDFYKVYEDNRMDDGKAMLADSVAVNFADGNKFMGSADSLISMGKQFRGMYSAVKITIDACMAVHSNDKNEDWVLIWDRSYTTDQKGKTDSVGGHSYWQIKNGKIAFWGEQQAKLTPPAEMKEK
ncbi:MAG: nuclear transport factor 2 family protein [Bacteroidota bacterium]